LVTFRERLPSLSDAGELFAVCALPVYIWSIIAVLREVPAWILRLPLWDVVGLIAYTQAFALVESILFFAAVVGLGLVLPAAWLRQRLPLQGLLLVVAATTAAATFHYAEHALRNWGVWGLGLLVLLPLLLFVLGSYLVRRYGRLEMAALAFVRRVSVLSYLYVSISFVGLLIVIARNIW
jgi:hypothetical protein